MEGNLLLDYGFERMRAPDAAANSSQYTLALNKNDFVRLWGFGLFYGSEHGGIYINRYDFTPRLASATQNGWQSIDEMRALPAAADTFLLERAMWWIAEYEHWVLSNYGKSYRSACLAGWSKCGLPESGLPSAWITLARELALCSEQSAIHDMHYLLQAEQTP
jgi:hypothetical protein